MKWLALLPSENYRLDFGWWDKHFDDLLSYNGSVTIALANNPGGGTLGGTLTVAAVNGVATFS